MSKKIVAVIVLVGLVGVGLFWYSGSQQKGQASYQYSNPQLATVRDIVSTTGLVEPQNRLEIIPPINGRIEQINVKEGQVVRRGQLLASMSSTDRAALLDAAQSEGPERVKYWQEVYRPTSLLAPIEGRVIVRSVEPGQTVSTGKAVLVLADRLIVKAQVDETDIGKVAIGQRVNIKLDAYPDIQIGGKVGHISYESKLVSNVAIYEVNIIPDRVPEIFRSGMSATVDIIRLEKKDVVVVPQRLVSYQGKKSGVLVKSNDFEPTWQQVVTGISYDGLIEIIEGLDLNSKVAERIENANGNGSAKSNSGSSFLQRPGQRRP